MPVPLITEDALKQAYQRQMRQGAPAGHLDEDTWTRLAAGDLAQQQRDEALDHVLRCETCSTIWHTLLALAKEAANEGLIQPQLPRRPWRSSFMPLAFAAAIILAIGGALLFRQPAPESTGVRSTATLPAVDGMMLAYSDTGLPNLLWVPVPEATAYRVEIFTDDGRPVWRGEAGKPPMPWPAEAPRNVGTYRWRVEAMGAGAPIARSPLVLLELTR